MNYHRDKDYLVSEKQFRNIFQKRFNLIYRHLGGVPGRTHRVKRHLGGGPGLPRGGRCLEIGCSTGTMLDIFKENGWETWGVEPSGSADTAKQKGHKIIKKYFENLPARPAGGPAGRLEQLPENYFDLVIMNHILEHLDNPFEVLSRIHKLLQPKGILFVDVPNAGGLGSKILGKHWPFLLPKEHKHQFTRQSLTSLLEKSGFKVIHWESRSGLFEYANPFLELRQALTGLKKRFFTDLLGFPYALVATAFNAGDSLSVIGKKD